MIVQTIDRNRNESNMIRTTQTEKSGWPTVEMSRFAVPWGPVKMAMMCVLTAFGGITSMPAAADGLPSFPRTHAPLPVPMPAVPRLVDCKTYAAAYADRYLGSGDANGEIVSGGMRGAVAGGAWAGASGARRGARAGGALGVLDNLASYPGGWEGLYAMAYELCRAETSGATRHSGSAVSGSGCRSRAGVATSSRRGPYSARSSSGGCQ